MPTIRDQFRFSYAMNLSKNALMDILKTLHQSVIVELEYMLMVGTLKPPLSSVKNAVSV